MSDVQRAGKPGRYNRSTGGLIGSMIVLLLVVLGFVLYRGVFRDTPEYELDHVDYLDLVVGLQQIGLEPVYPATLPEGWFAKGTSSMSDAPLFDVALVTDDDRFAGVHQEDASIDDLVATYVGNDAVEGDAVRVDGSVAPTWETYSDPGGDHAFAAEVGDDAVLVYGSADEDGLLQLVESLTTEQLTP